MKLYKDLFTGDEVISDSFKQEWLFGDVVFQVQSGLCLKGGFALPDDEEGAGDDVEKVNNIIDTYKYNEVAFD